MFVTPPPPRRPPRRTPSLPLENKKILARSRTKVANKKDQEAIGFIRYFDRGRVREQKASRNNRFYKSFSRTESSPTPSSVLEDGVQDGVDSVLGSGNQAPDRTPSSSSVLRPGGRSLRTERIPSSGLGIGLRTGFRPRAPSSVLEDGIGGRSPPCSVLRPRRSVLRPGGRNLRFSHISKFRPRPAMTEFDSVLAPSSPVRYGASTPP